MRPILIISNADDGHIPFVTRHLGTHDVVRIDPVDIIKGQSLDYRFNQQGYEILYNGKALRNVRSVWYRRPSVFELDKLPVAERNRTYAYSSLKRHTGAVLDLMPDAFWMSDRRAIRMAANKPLQMARAAELGFNIPDTLFASSAVQADAFVKRHKVCVAKPQAIMFPDRQITFTRIIRESDQLDYSGLHCDPYIFQQKIDPKLELRVTVVGNQVFTATVHGNEDDTTFRDWRYAHVNDTFSAEPYELPASVVKRCKQLVHGFGLQYSALDFIVDKHDKLWFLESNPNGQWAFIEDVTGQPIGKAIADTLVAGKAL